MIVSTLHVRMPKSILASTLLVLSSLSLSSCQDEDFGFTSDEVRASVYKRNFEGMYGEIDPDQTWDFSSYNLRKLGLTGGPSTGTRAAFTRAAIPDLVTKYESGWYTVSDQTTTWLNNNLEEKKNNTKYVSSFNWEKVENSDPLYIIPIYQGQTGMIWDLELVDLDNHTSSIIWSKSENLQYTQHYAVWDEFFYESWKDEAPNTSLKNRNGVDDNKLITLKFSKPLASLPSTFTSSDDIIAAFTVSENIPGNFKEGSTIIKVIPGAFYITLGTDTQPTKITSSNCNAFFTDKVNKDFVKDANNGLFHFTSAGNFVLNVDRYLSSSAPNKVMLNVLLGQTINEHQITVDDLKTLQFIIDDSFDYPYGSDGKFSHDYTFNTWSPDRIHVYVKYNEGGYGETVSLKDGENQYTEHHTINKYHVQTRPIRIDINKLSGTNFALNLKTKYRGDGDKDLSEIGDDHRSDQGFMSQINHFSEGNSPLAVSTLVNDFNTQFGITDLATSDGKYEYMVIGCEDAGANGKSSDQDYNDLVLLVVGKTLPTQTIKKRYMIEDLGSTLDFDFNDIVVDVTEKVARTNAGGKTYTQTAAIRHLRGTIPFRVTIGSLGKFGTGGNEGKIMRGHNCKTISYDPSTVEAIKSEYIWTHTEVVDTDAKLTALRSNYWNPDENNIHVEVWPSYNSENNNSNDVFWGQDKTVEADNSNATGNNVQSRKIVEFPKKGKVPYIIAVDPTVQWMEENISIPEFWIATRPENFNNNFDQSDKTEDDKPTGTGIPAGGNKLNNTTSLPAGQFALSNTSTTIDASHSLSIPANAFNDVYVGDEIIVHVDVNNVYDKSRFDFKPSTEAIKKIGANGSVVVTGDYAIKVDEALLKDLQTNGLQIGGQYVTVNSVDVKSDGGAKITNRYEVAESAYKLSTQRTVIRSYSNSVTLSNSELQKLYVGDKIVVHVDNIRENSSLGFKKNTENWPAFDYDGGLLVSQSEIEGDTGTTVSNNAKVTGDIILKVNNDNINDIKNGSGLVINGQYITIKSVDIQNAINNSTPLSQGSIKLDESQHVITGYSNTFTISAEKFRYLGLGDKIIFHVSSLRNNGSNSQSVLGVHYENPDSDGKRDNVPGFVNNEYGNLFGVTKDVELTITNDNIAKMQQYGLFINGVNITVDAVTVVPSQNLLWNNAAGTSVDANKAFDQFAYGRQQTLYNVLPSSGSVTLRFYFKESVSGNVTFFTPHAGIDETGAFTGGWTPFNTSRTAKLDNYGYYDITFSQEEIGLIKSRGGLILQNNDIENFSVVAVRKM